MKWYPWMSILFFWAIFAFIVVVCELTGLQNEWDPPGYGKSIQQLVPELPQILLYSLLTAVIVAWVLHGT